MKNNPFFQEQSNEFWALVKYASETLGYSRRSRKTGDSVLRRYTLLEVQALTDRFTITDDVERVVEYLI